MLRTSASLVFASALFVSFAARAESLDGASLAVKLTAKGEAPIDDRLVFAGGQLESTACTSFGFQKARYAAKESGGKTTFTATLTSAKEGTMLFAGTVKGDVVEGTATWTKGSAKPTVYAIGGKKLPSLYERLGGAGSIAVVVDDFIDRLNEDEVLNKNPAIASARSRVAPAHLKFHVTTLMCQVTGGPCTYVGRSMKDSHAKLGITSAEWKRMADVFVAVLDDHKVPKETQAELLAIVSTTRQDIVTR